MRLCRRSETFRSCIPAWHDAPGPHPQNQGLFRQRNRSRPFKAEGAEVGDRGDGASCGIRRQAASGSSIKARRTSSI